MAAQIEMSSTATFAYSALYIQMGDRRGTRPCDPTRSGELFNLHGGSFVFGRTGNTITLGTRDEIQKDFGCVEGGERLAVSNAIANFDG